MVENGGVPVLNTSEDISIEELSVRTGINLEDTLHTLTAMQMLKYYKGNHIICLSEKHREGAMARADAGVVGARSWRVQGGRGCCVASSVCPSSDLAMPVPPRPDPSDLSDLSGSVRNLTVPWSAQSAFEFTDYKKSMEKTKVKIDPACLDWKPPVFTSAQLRYV